MTAMTDPAAPPGAAGPPDDHRGCVVCSGGTPDAAYRPHTFGPDCWCVPYSMINRECRMTEYYGITAG